MYGMSTISKKSCQGSSPMPRTKKISVAAFLSVTDLSSHFHLPMFEQAQQEYVQLQGIIQDIQLREENKD